MYLDFAKRLSLCIYKTHIEVLTINDSRLKIHEIVIATFLVKNKTRKS